MSALALLFVQICEAKAFFKEEFTEGTAMTNWTQSNDKEYGAFAWQRGEKYDTVVVGKGIKTIDDAHFYALSSRLPEPYSNLDSKLVLAFTVKHQQEIDCGGGYIKLLPEQTEGQFNGESEYFIMFGPDICGPVRKIHLIFHYNGKNLLWKKEPRCADDTLTHSYKLVLNTNNTYEVYMDGDKLEEGSLEDDWEFLPTKVIDDPEDAKPSEWVDAQMMDDPSDVKPDDWDDEPEKIADPKAELPAHWDEEEDGAWQAPLVANSKFRGEWKAKRIKNPLYKGKWAPRKIPNPEYVPDEQLYFARKPIATVGFDLWQVKSGSVFDNIIISDSVEEVDAFLESRLLGLADKEKELLREKQTDENTASAEGDEEPKEDL